MGGGSSDALAVLVVGDDDRYGVAVGVGVEFAPAPAAASGVPERLRHLLCCLHLLNVVGHVFVVPNETLDTGQRCGVDPGGDLAGHGRYGTGGSGQGHIVGTVPHSSHLVPVVSMVNP